MWSRKSPPAAVPASAEAFPVFRSSRFVRASGLLFAAAVWSALVFFSLWSQREQLDRTAEALARIDAIANLKKDMAIRKWASSTGGIYIREDKAPNRESLAEQERIVGERLNGQRFELVTVTPIHILLAIQGISNETSENGSKERLTSLQLRNRANLPDDWEVNALKSLQAGGDMVTEAVPRRGSHGLMRVMIPMRMEKECLECHRDTLVPVGGLRGGAAVSVNLNAYRTAQDPTWRTIQYWHLGIWLLGLTAIHAYWFFSRRRALEQVRREEERRVNETAFSAMAEGAIITDAQGIIRWVNDAFCRIYGYARDEVIGKTPRILKSGRHDESFYKEFWRQLISAGHWRGEVWNRRKTGEIFPEELSIQALRGPDGLPVRYISVFSDITERKRNEDELEKHREHLEDLVRQRTEELTEARDQAETANRAKSQFLANMSHELRTPLHAVIGFSQLMNKDATLSPVQRRNIGIVNSSANHLLTLINDILELSKIESGKVRMAEEETELEDLLRQVVDMMRVRAEEAGLELHLETHGLPPVVTLDAVKLRQVLLNLLSNAVKFTPQGRVSVFVSGRPVGDGQVNLDFTVADTGIGIAAEDQQRIFQPFEQAVAYPPPGGTGLGLTISRQYVQMMGGQLTVQSAPGQGAAFRFSVVAGAGTMPAVVAERGPSADAGDAARGRRVLVVDDAAEARLLVRSLLEPYGIEVAEAVDGIEAERIVDAWAPELVLMDWRLPGIDGMELIRRIHGRAGHPHIVMLTANALAEGREQALAAGANEYMSKPYQAEDFYRLIERSLGVTLPRGGERTPPAPAEEEPEIDADDLASLSGAVRSELYAAAVSLDPERIAEALAAVATENADLAERLHTLVETMHYHRLWRILGISATD